MLTKFAEWAERGAPVGGSIADTPAPAPPPPAASGAAAASGADVGGSEGAGERREAYATMLTSDSFAPGVEALLSSLKAAQSSNPRGKRHATNT